MKPANVYVTRQLCLQKLPTDGIEGNHMLYVALHCYIGVDIKKREVNKYSI